MTRRRAIGVLSGLLVVIALAGCATSSNAAFHSSMRSLAGAPTTTVPPTTTTTAPCTDQPGTEPASELPRPGEMPAGTYLADIQQRGFLEVGVDENTIGFAARNPQTAKLEGFEIALVDEIARAIFGDPTRIRYISVVTAEKVDVVKQGKVDLTASTVSITCERARDVAFSSMYFETVQRVMVSARSKFLRLSDLVGKKICVTQGGTTVDKVKKVGAIPYPVEKRTDCLVALQQGRVDAIATHDTILRGLHLQDPKGTRILAQDQLPGEQRYGVAIAKSHPELVGFVNGVLEQLHENGTYDRLLARYVTPLFDDSQNTVAAEGAPQ